jgi:Winged helix-turn-helix domain (DUF2582)
MSAKKAASKTTVKRAKSSDNGKAKVMPPTLSAHHIGAVAGEVWAVLASGDGQTLAAIKKKVAAPPDVVLAAVGWLAREGKLEFATSGRTVKLSLK